MTHAYIFEFERDFAQSLRCVPMAVRLKLDLSGIKLSLRQWSRFTPADRRRLLDQTCETAAEIEDYRVVLIELIASRAGEPAKPLLEDVTRADWEQVQCVPPALLDYARLVGLREPELDEWVSMTRLQRFALLKLTRDHHDNINFGPAMHEFGLARDRDST